MITLSDFAGAWQIARRIEDANELANGSFEGTATFTKVNDTRLSYYETGLLHLSNGHKMQGERGYVWQQQGDLISVLFTDGRPFHEFDLRDRSSAEHLCDPDVYRVSYDFAKWPAWQSCWRVTGPRKDYVMTTSYSR